MNKESYKKAYFDARIELSQALNTRDELDKRIAKLRQTVASLAQLCEDDSLEGAADSLSLDMGLTEACREVLRAADSKLTGPEVKKGLEKIGFDTSQYSNPLASIYPTLNRLGDKGEVIVGEIDGKKTYEIKRAGLLSRFKQPSGALRMGEQDANTQTDVKTRRLSSPPSPLKRLGKKE